MLKNRNGKDLTEAEEIKKSEKKTQENYAKKVSVTRITMMVWSLTKSQTFWSMKSSGP